MKIFHETLYMDYVETLLFVVKQNFVISVLASIYCTLGIVPTFSIHHVKVHQIQVNTFIKVSTSSSFPPSNGAVRRKINLFLFQFVSMSWTNLNRFLPADHDDKAKSVVVNFNKITINFTEMTRKRPYFTRKWEV